MSGSNGKTIIYTVELAEFTVEGEPYDVSYINVTLCKNDVPTAQIGIAPDYHVKKSNVHKLDVKSLKKAYSKLMEKAERLAKSKLHIKLKATDHPEFDQELCLQDWLLASVGMTHVSATDLFTLECTITHPVYKTTLREGMYFDAAWPLNQDELDKSQNPLQAAHVVFNAIEDDNKSAPINLETSAVSTSMDNKDENQVADIIKNGAKEALADLDETLMWDIGFSHAKNNIPFETYLGDVEKKGIRRALSYGWLEDKGSTVWHRLINTICPWFICEVICNYAQESPGCGAPPKLKVTPINPWRRVKVHLNDLRVHAFDMPSYDQFPVYGTTMDQMSGSAPQSATVSFKDVESWKLEIQPARFSYIPKTANKSIGRLIHCQDPPWLHLARDHAAPLGGVPTMTFGPSRDYDDELEMETPPVGSGDHPQMIQWNTCRTAWLVDKFVQEYRAHVTATCYCALTVFTEQQELVYPGKRMVYLTGGEQLFTGEIERVEHSIDCARSTANTMIQVAYCDVDGKASEVLGGPSTLLFPTWQVQGFTDASASLPPSESTPPPSLNEATTPSPPSNLSSFKPISSDFPPGDSTISFGAGGDYDDDYESNPPPSPNSASPLDALVEGDIDAFKEAISSEPDIDIDVDALRGKQLNRIEPGLFPPLHRDHSNDLKAIESPEPNFADTLQKMFGEG